MIQSADKVSDRRSEWFVPRFGPEKVRLFIGMLFLPYTGMVLAFATIGSMLAPRVHWGRVVAINIIYFLGLGIAAHCLDALGSKGIKPWGMVFPRRQLWLITLASLTLAYAIAIYFMIVAVPNLWIIAVIEGFFVFAYNLEWFNGKFHTDNWFAFSWGFLPVLAGCVMQQNRISAEALILAVSMAFFSLVEIKASRPYKELKRNAQLLSEGEKHTMERYEAILKAISLGTISLGIGLMTFRLLG
jgi:hypothetical protein